jgi:hypothetical protein
MNRELPKLWVIYRKPPEFPKDYVARLFTVQRGELRPTAETRVAHTLIELRAELIGQGMVRMPRAQHDGQHIVESWL